MYKRILPEGYKLVGPPPAWKPGIAHRSNLAYGRPANTPKPHTQAGTEEEAEHTPARLRACCERRAPLGPSTGPHSLRQPRRGAVRESINTKHNETRGHTTHMPMANQNGKDQHFCRPTPSSQQEWSEKQLKKFREDNQGQSQGSQNASRNVAPLPRRFGSGCSGRAPPPSPVRAHVSFAWRSPGLAPPPAHPGRGSAALDPYARLPSQSRVRLRNNPARASRVTRPARLHVRSAGGSDPGEHHPASHTEVAGRPATRRSEPVPLRVPCGPCRGGTPGRDLRRAREQLQLLLQLRTRESGAR